MNEREFEIKFNQLKSSAKCTSYKEHVILNETPEDSSPYVLKAVGDYGAFTIEHAGLFFALRLVVEKIDQRTRKK